MKLTFFSVYYYVPKVPNISQSDSKKEKTKFLLQNAWRKSYSLREKDKLKNLEDVGGKKVLRFLKGLTHSDPALKGITSYDWKNILFHLTDNEGLSWADEHFVERVFYMIRLMAYFIEKKNLPLYFEPKINLFCNMEDKVQKRVFTRLMSLYKNEKKFDKKFLKTTSDEKKKKMETTNQTVDEQASSELVKQASSELAEQASSELVKQASDTNENVKYGDVSNNVTDEENNTNHDLFSYDCAKNDNDSYSEIDDNSYNDSDNDSNNERDDDNSYNDSDNDSYIERDDNRYNDSDNDCYSEDSLQLTRCHDDDGYSNSDSDESYY